MKILLIIAASLASAFLLALVLALVLDTIFWARRMRNRERDGWYR